MYVQVKYRANTHLIDLLCGGVNIRVDVALWERFPSQSKIVKLTTSHSLLYDVIHNAIDPVPAMTIR